MPDHGGKLTLSAKARDDFRKKEQEDQDKQPGSATCPECGTQLPKDKNCVNGIWHCPNDDNEF